ncbi:Pectate lyase superfamily protein [Pustulibacterium marinum]|uniref:Pectate lyase superfamily protein n=1 Tax=Pustulibacterium marinum TaxID=1224947 RepID=A0A1I7IAJ9_9FLAO|nr:glycosyl hydrolase family 28 protein [Pustulibacterium marinum]SFU69941.1 Pectate lyase superfamily protein [Pustulibacterium marinum]
MKKLLFLLMFSIGTSMAQPLDLNIISEGAKPDGITKNTEIIQNAIDHIHQAGGGTLFFPKGKYVTGTIQLKSNVQLYFDKDSELLGSTDPRDYKVLDVKNIPLASKKDDNSQLALLLAYKASNVKIYGKGSINGQGLDLALAIDSLHHAGIRVDSAYNYRRKRPSELARPKLFRFSECKNVEISALQLGEAACWGLSFELCENLTLANLTITNRSYWNNDGIDITDCDKVSITGCDINSADDGICLKSYFSDYCNNDIFISDCTIRSSASAIKFGSASYGGFKNIVIQNIKVYDTFRSAIAIESVDGAVIENVQVNNLTAKNTGNAIFIRLGHRDGEKPGSIQNINIKNLKVEVPFGRPDLDYKLRGPEVNYFHNPFPAIITGIPNHYIEEVSLENVEIQYPGKAFKGMAYVPLSGLDRVPEEVKGYPEFTMFGELPAWAFYVRHVKGLIIKNLKLTLKDEDYRPAFVFDDAYKIELNNIEIPKKNKKQIILNNSKYFSMDKSLEMISKNQ